MQAFLSNLLLKTCNYYVVQDNKIEQIPLNPTNQAVNQRVRHMCITLFLLIELPRPVSSSSNIQLEGGYLQGCLYLPAIIQIIIGTISDTNEINSN